MAKKVLPKTDQMVMPEIVPVERDRIRPNEWNPNEMDPEVFNELVSNIEEYGFVQPIIIATLADEEYDFQITDGEHRFEGLAVLGIDTIPCIVKDVSEDKQKFQTVKLNRLKGKFNTKKFTNLVSDLMERYTFEEVAENLAFTDPTELEAMIENARDVISDPDMRNEFDKAKDEIKTVDDLSNVLNRLFTKYGDTLPANFMILDFGGKDSIWVRMPRREFAKIRGVARDVLGFNATFDSFLTKLLSVTPVEKFIDKYRETIDEPKPEDKDTIDDI